MNYYFAIDLSSQLINNYDSFNKYYLAHECGSVIIKKIPVNSIITQLDQNLIWKITKSKEEPKFYNITTIDNKNLHGIITPFTIQEHYIPLTLNRDNIKTNWNIIIHKHSKNAEINLAQYPHFYLGMNKIINDLSNIYLPTITTKKNNYYNSKIYNSTNKYLNLIPISITKPNYINIIQDKFEDITDNTIIIYVLFIIIFIIALIYIIYICYSKDKYYCISSFLNAIAY